MHQQKKIHIRLLNYFENWFPRGNNVVLKYYVKSNDNKIFLLYNILLKPIATHCTEKSLTVFDLYLVKWKYSIVCELFVFK